MIKPRKVLDLVVFYMGFIGSCVIVGKADNDELILCGLICMFLTALLFILRAMHTERSKF
jgi:hypothetical protein